MTSNIKRFSALLLTAAMIATVGCAGSPRSESTGEVLDDTVITTKVKAAFVNDPMVKAREVSVETFKGEVQLSGWVNSQAEVNQAVNIARNVAGVSSVRNNIRIR